MNEENKKESFGKFDFNFKNDVETEKKDDSSTFVFSNFAREEKFLGDLKHLKKEVEDTEDTSTSNDDFEEKGAFQTETVNMSDILEEHDDHEKQETVSSDQNMMFSFEDSNRNDEDYILKSTDDYDETPEDKENEILDDYDDDEIETLDLYDYYDYNDDVLDNEDAFFEENNDHDNLEKIIDNSTISNVNSNDNSMAIADNSIDSNNNSVETNGNSFVSNNNSVEVTDNSIRNKIYISFEERVAISILIVVILFLSSCFLIYKAVTFSRPQKVSYKESSAIKYSVCLNNNDFYNQSCLNENMKYISELTNKIDTTFKYNVSFSEDVEYDLAYHVIGVTRINDGINPEQSLYENEEILVEKTNLSNTKNSIDIESNVLIDYKKFNGYVTEYKARYALNAVATLEVILYLDEPHETRKVASLVIPLNENTFFINKNVISKKNKVVEIDGKMWNEHTIICTVIALISIVIALMILFKTTSLVLKVTSKRNKYQNMLNQILTEYDSMIVIARNGYVSTVEKQVIKVDSFKELLDAKENLGKPIIYSKINNVKSEFIVEDVEVLYKFILKEADLEED